MLGLKSVFADKIMGESVNIQSGNMDNDTRLDSNLTKITSEDGKDMSFNPIFIVLPILILALILLVYKKRL